jgi:hypothetical protein
MGRLIGRKPIEININSPQGGHLPIYDGDLRIWGTIGSSSLFSSGGLISGSQQVYLTGTTGYNEFSASYTDLSSSFLELSSSYASNFVSASFTGSFKGDGSQLNNVPFSGVTGLAFYSASVSVQLDSLEVESGSIRNDFNSFTSSYRTGSFTGSFIGDGTQLTNIPASGVTGLQLNQIIDGSATASISQLNGLRINVDSEITGSLSVSETISSSFIGNGSGLYNIPATGVTGLELNKIINGSISASLVNNALRVNTDLYVDGTITAKEIHVEYVSSSVLYESGSTKFGDSIDDIHSITGSVLVDGKVKASSLTGSINFTNLTNVPTLVSGSSQIEITGTTGYSTFSSSLENTYLHIEGDGVYSSSAQITGNIYTPGSSFTIQDLVLGAGTTFGKITTDGSKYISVMPTYNVESARFWPNGNVTIQNGGDYVDNGFRLEVSGSARIVGDTQITGSLIVTGTVVSETTPLVSGSSQVIYSGLTGIPSGIVSGSSQISNLGFAITGSNIFVGNQTVTGSSDITGDLTVRGNLTAQQFIVSSSVTYLTTSFSSGSTKFGDSSDDNHNFTGSVKITGSLNVTNNVLTLTGSLPTPLVIERSAAGNSNIQYKNTVGSYYAGITQFGSFAIGSTNNDLGTNAQLSIFPTRGNVIIQNGGSPTDNGYRLQVIGSDAPSGSLYVSGSSNFTGSMVVGINGSEELQVYQSGVTIGNVVTDTHKVTGSLNVTGSGTITGNLTVQGNLTARQLIISSSVTYLTESFASGSHTFGNTLDDTHNFTGSVLITGSLKVNGVVTGSLNISGSEAITGSLFVSSSGVAASLIGSGSGVFTVDGTSGRLFQIDDSLSGSLFSVNTAAGLPLMEGFSDNTVRIGQFGQKALYVSQSMVGFGTETPIYKADISGSLRVTNQLIISSSLLLNQNTSSLASGTRTISTNATSSFTSVFYNYTLASGSNARAGQVMAVWNGNSIQYTDNSTTDIGTTGNVALTASLSTGNVVLSTVLPTTGWTIKSFVNLL